MEVISSIYNSGYNIKKFYLGSQELNLAYLGNQVVYDEVIGDNGLSYILYEFYGSDILANTVEAPVKRAILKGSTKLLDEVGNECSPGDDRPNVTFGAYINPKDGKEVASTSSFRTPYIKAPTQTFKVRGKNRWKKIAFYRADKVFLKGIDSSIGNYNDWTITQANIPSDAKYMRVSASLSPVSSADIVEQALHILDVNNSNLYKTQSRSCELHALTTVGKNLFDGEIKTNANINSSTGVEAESGTSAITLNFTRVEPSTIYTLTRSNANGAIGMRYYGCAGHFISSQNLGSALSLSFTTPENCSLIKFIDQTNIADNSFQIEKGAIATTYEPFKSNILTVNEDVTLRSNGDVYDELNLLTGRLTQRIGENNEVLAQAVVKTVDLTIVDQDGKTINKLNSFNGTTYVSTEVAENSTYPMVSLEVASELQAAMSKVAEDIELIKPVQNDIETTVDTQSNDIDSLLLATTELFEMFL